MQAIFFILIKPHKNVEINLILNSAPGFYLGVLSYYNPMVLYMDGVIYGRIRDAYKQRDISSFVGDKKCITTRYSRSSSVRY